MPTTIDDIMTREVLSLEASQPLIDALEFLRREKVRHIPILGEDGGLVGLVTDRDVKRATPSVLGEGARAEWERVVRETSLRTIMTHDPITVAPTTRLRAAIELFVKHKVGCLPVLKDGQLVGIVSSRDLFAAVLELLPAG